MQTQSIDWKKTRAARDYRAFLQCYLEDRSLSLSTFARLTGFGRGFPGDVISGKRRLTAKSFPAFERALKLPTPGKKLLRLLVAREEVDLFPDLDRAGLEDQIEQIRKISWARGRRDVKSGEFRVAPHVFRDAESVRVYAAVGKPGSGATLIQIQELSKVASPQLDEILTRLQRADLIKFDSTEQTYELLDLHLFFGDQAHLQLGHAIFQQACARTKQRSTQAFQSRDELFLTSMLCVHESRMSELKLALKETVLKFVDDSLDPSGDQMVQLTVALHR